MEPDTNPLGALLIEAREAKGLTQEDVASRLETDRGTVGRWERGESTPRKRARAELAAILGLPPERVEEAADAAFDVKDAKASSAPSSNASVDDGRVWMSREDYGYLRGSADMFVAWMDSLDTSIVAMRDHVAGFRTQLERATNKAREMARVLPPGGPSMPAPPAPPRDRPRISPEELRGRDEVLGKRERDAS